MTMWKYFFVCGPIDQDAATTDWVAHIFGPFLFSTCFDFQRCAFTERRLQRSHIEQSGRMMQFNVSYIF